MLKICLKNLRFPQDLSVGLHGGQVIITKSRRRTAITFNLKTINHTNSGVYVSSFVCLTSNLTDKVRFPHAWPSRMGDMVS